MAGQSGQCRAIITDWGGVLTSPLRETIDAWLVADGIDQQGYRAVMRSWVEGAYAGGPAATNPIHALERGEVPVAEFERMLAAELRLLDGGPVPAEGLITRMFSGFHPVEEMYALLRQARERRVRTCLLSNSWGNGYPHDRFAETFDAVVISGEVGMRKPEPGIFRRAVELTGVPAEECVFIDDIEHNVRAAVELGMTGILHTDPAETRERLAETCGVEFDPLPS
ncbi:HAD family hydrolase [Streptomonospora nanhaiensis]|uniref:Putative hydrolase of the HAD superfamily n=1 Tax=Streptomonospora nanhaiensis TaxID=1323731 RepID=A0A853BN22_9ACTN|nr:HAD family phosphatase [Streptomonospora nanhaiensis]MBV2362114.1 HAD family phosphatase [Streptomonospora nanhaiensis]MBV2364814.1 HAD family phosphatase [Streptomonospora nanhaiensis]MBX9388567.1 HAD family phosphatase [Streptomonospora nanhaiensis]NYI96057.1 putative hydrolase of the HAD superfamily [Streptomonospora nanhaiensis]